MQSFRVFIILTSVGLMAVACAGSDQRGPDVNITSPAASPAPSPIADTICNFVGKCADTCMLNYPHVEELVAQQDCPANLGAGACQEIINTNNQAAQNYQSCVGSLSDQISIPPMPR